MCQHFCLKSPIQFSGLQIHPRRCPDFAAEHRLDPEQAKPEVWMLRGFRSTHPLKPGRSRTESDGFSRCKFFTSYKLQFTIYNLQFTSYNLQVTIYKLQFTSYKLQVTLYKLQVTICKLKFTIYKLKITSYNLQL